METKERIEMADAIAYFAMLFAVLLVIVAVLDTWNFPEHNYFGLFFVGALVCFVIALYARRAKRERPRPPAGAVDN
jgi:4-hydroxybenzoate polyprenyltransferase